MIGLKQHVHVTNGEITNEEFVRVIDYLTERESVEISSVNDKKVQR